MSQTPHIEHGTGGVGSGATYGFAGTGSQDNEAGSTCNCDGPEGCTCPPDQCKCSHCKDTNYHHKSHPARLKVHHQPKESTTSTTDEESLGSCCAPAPHTTAGAASFQGQKQCGCSTDGTCRCKAGDCQCNPCTCSHTAEQSAAHKPSTSSSSSSSSSGCSCAGADGVCTCPPGQCKCTNCTASHPGEGTGHAAPRPAVTGI